MSADPYAALIDPSAHFAGIDQGIDFTGPGTIHAIGDATVIRVANSGTGWPGQGALIAYKLDNPIDGHQYVYNAEDLQPLQLVGAHVKRGAAIARATGAGLAPGVEIGWADAGGRPLAPRPPARPAPQYTSEGQNFDNVVQQLSKGGGGSIVSGVIGGAEGVAGAAAGAVGSAAGAVGGVVGGIAGVPGAIAGGIGDVWGAVTSSETWIRVGLGVAGLAMIVMGLSMALGGSPTAALAAVPK